MPESRARFENLGLIFGVGAYGILNGKATWASDLSRGDHAKLSLWGKNLTNQYYATQVIGLGGGPVDVAAQPPGARR